MLRPVITYDGSAPVIEINGVRRKVRKSVHTDHGPKLGTVKIVVLEPENPVSREEVEGNRSGLDGVLKNLGLKIGWPHMETPSPQPSGKEAISEKP